MQWECSASKPFTLCKQPQSQSGFAKSGAFFSEEELSIRDYARAIVEVTGFKGKFDLCLDRSNWDFGEKRVNYLVLSWRINKGVSLPLMFVDLDKAGNSNTTERLDLLETFKDVFGFDRIKSLVADREFVGNKWFTALNKNRIPYFIRVKKNTLLPWGKKPIKAEILFQHFQKSYETRLIEKNMYQGTVYFAGTLSKSADFVIVMSNQFLTAKQILAQYRKRWSIEELFRKLKTSGLHWENTHMKHSQRLVSLLIVLSFGLLIASLIGQRETIPWKKTIGYPLYSIFRKGMITLQFLFAHSLTELTQAIQKAFITLQYAGFL